MTGRLVAGVSLVAVMAVLCPSALLAQTSPSPAADAAAGDAPPAADTPQDIVVTGFRQSLQRAAEIKRNASNVSDVISAEDIGKFPDQNLADSLQRITGVQITRTNGEGQKISVRGLSPDFTQTLYNGRVLTTPGGGRSFEFANLASDFVNTVQVSKSPTADMVAGGLAATVNITTLRPLDLGHNQVSMTAEGLYEQKADKFEPHVSLFVNHKFSDEFGINFGINYQRREFRSDTFRGFGFEHGYESIKTPNLDYNRDGYFNDDFLFNSEAGTRVILGSEKRLTGVFGVQARPTDNIEFYGDFLYAKYNSKLNQPINTLRFTSINCPPGERGVAPGGCVKGSDFDSDGLIDYLDADGVDYRNDNTESDTYNTTTSAAGGVKATFGRLKANAEVSYSNSRQLANNFVPTFLARANAYYDFRDNKELPEFGFDRGFDPLDASNFYGLGFAGDYHRPRHDHNWDAKLDLDYDAGDGFLRSIKVGVRYGNQRQSIGTSQIKVSATQLAGLLGLPTFDTVDGKAFDASGFMRLYSFKDFFDGYGGAASYPSSFLSADNALLFDQVSLKDILTAVPPVRSLASEYTVLERETSAYARADFAAFDDRLSGNVGLRFVHTDQTSSGYAPDLSQITLSASSVTQVPSVTPARIRRSYTDWLPSLNVRYNLTDQLVVRAAAAKVMSRPTLGTLSPSTTVNANTSTITVNNPYVDPYRANQADLSLEYYFGQGGLVSAAVFYKDVKNFVVATQHNEVLQVTRTDSGEVVPINFSVSQPDNGAGGTLKGLELDAQVPLTFLPGLLDGFGILANFTYLDAGKVATVQGGPALALPGVSKYSYNLVGYYQKGPFSARLAYNYRSHFVNSTTSNFGDGSYGAGYGQLDFSTSLDITKHVSLTVEGQNLNDAAVVTTNVYGYGRGYEDVGRRFTVGVRAKF